MDNELHGSVNFISGKFIAPTSCGAGAVSSQEAITLTSGWEKAPLPVSGVATLRTAIHLLLTYLLPEMENKPEFLGTFALFYPKHGFLCKYCCFSVFFRITSSVSSAVQCSRICRKPQSTFLSRGNGAVEANANAAFTAIKESLLPLVNHWNIRPIPAAVRKHGVIHDPELNTLLHCLRPNHGYKHRASCIK